jgi:hypothetical protein
MTFPHYNKDFEFNLQVSLDFFDWKSQMKWVEKVNHFDEFTFNIDSIVDRLMEGRFIGHIDSRKNKTIGGLYTNKDNSQFVQTNFVGIDLTHRDGLLDTLITTLPFKPTFANTTVSSTDNELHAHLFYVFNHIVDNVSIYRLRWGELANMIKHYALNGDSINFNNESAEPYYAFYGNPKEETIFYKSYLIYD